MGNTTTAGYGKLDVDMGGTGANQSTVEASNRWRKYPTNFLYSGYFATSSASYRGSYGIYWSSTAYTTTRSYRLYLTNTSVYPGTSSYYRYHGHGARCIAGQ